MKKLNSIEELNKFRQSLKDKINPQKVAIRICMTGCKAKGADGVYSAFVEELKKKKLSNEVNLIATGCHGFCSCAPIVVIDPEGIFYQKITPEDVPEIINETILNKKIIERLCFKDPNSNKTIIYEKDIPFYKGQMKNVLKNCGKIDPTKITAYIEQDGYKAISKVLDSLSPEEVIDIVTKSGLRGRGGAGFPTGIKWNFTRKAKGDVKYIVCNGDEGDPGAFMDRAVLEGDPHSVIEGMLIAAFAIGAKEGYIYVRAEYPIAVQHLKIAIPQAEELGLLGNNILGKDFTFNIHLKEGAGAFVCGEETALLASIEGKRGMPRTRPPFPANEGLWGKPTCINNVETLANIPRIINDGWEKFASVGTEKSKGTKIFALAGKINNTGLVEVPMGITLRDIVFNVGGGIPENKKFKAVLTGGPSGGCIPESLLDLPVDYESLTSSGSIMGSGGMIVMDEKSCIVDIAKYFLSFTQSESCGKCVPCRLGTKRMLEILTRITEGKGEEKDIEKLYETAMIVKDSSLCGLGQTAPNPVLTTIKYFKDEYLEHIINKHCPAGVCQALIKYVIIEEKCIGCGACAKVCPQKAISGEKKKPHKINYELCIKCGACYSECKKDAIAIM